MAVEFMVNSSWFRDLRGQGQGQDWVQAFQGSGSSLYSSSYLKVQSLFALLSCRMCLNARYICPDSSFVTTYLSNHAAIAVQRPACKYQYMKRNSITGQVLSQELTTTLSSNILTYIRIIESAYNSEHCQLRDTLTSDYLFVFVFSVSVSQLRQTASGHNQPAESLEKNQLVI